MTQLPASLDLFNNSQVTNLEFEIRIDRQSIYSDYIPPGDSTVEFTLPDDGNGHTLTLVLKGKGPEHTTIDSNGNIINDVLIKVSNVLVDNVNIDQILLSHAIYKHNYNGTGPEVNESYATVLGCNGEVTLQFNSPVYIWILENI